MKVSEIVKTSDNIKSLIKSLGGEEIRVQTPAAGFSFIFDDLYSELEVIVAKQALRQIEKLSALGVDDFVDNVEFLKNFIK